MKVGRILLLTAGLVALLVFLNGCATVGQHFPVAPVSQIEIGSTTMSDIRSMFGAPWRTGVEDGQRTWTYGHYKYKLFGRTRTEDLVVRFGDDDLVTSYTFNTTEHPIDGKDSESSGSGAKRPQ